MKPSFPTADALASRIENYFIFIEGAYHLENTPAKQVKDQQSVQKIWDREPEPPTFAGLALFLGFSSIKAFDDYTGKGKFSAALKQGRLRIEASYEKKLHAQSATGAIFALKTMGWNERAETRGEITQFPKTIQVEILDSGPKLAETEKDVIL